VISASGAVEIDREIRALLARSAVVLWIRGSVRLLTELGDPTHRPRLADGQQEALARLERELAALYADGRRPRRRRRAVPRPRRRPRRSIARHILQVLATGPCGCRARPGRRSTTNGTTATARPALAR
jgi:shikimate kinase